MTDKVAVVQQGSLVVSVPSSDPKPVSVQPPAIVVSVVQQPALVVTVQAPPKLVVTVPIGVSGPPGPPGTGSITWDYYATNWTTAPAQVGTTAAGAVYGYTLTGTTRYRLVPSPYVAAQDAFYSGWDGAALSGLIVSRG